jgi:hypothetical protein
VKCLQAAIFSDRGDGPELLFSGRRILAAVTDDDHYQDALEAAEDEYAMQSAVRAAYVADMREVLSRGE